MTSAACVSTLSVASRSFSRATIRHFFNIGEMLGPILISLHNIRFYQRLMAKIRQAIEKNEFHDWATEQLKRLKIAKKP